MTHDPHHRIDLDRLRDIAVRGRLMLCGLFAWLAEMFGASPIGRAMRGALYGDLLALRRGVAGILILLALPQLAPRGFHGMLPLNAPRGFRRARRKESLRFAQRLLPWARDLRGRMAALAAVLDNLDAWIERMAAHIARDDDLVAALLMTCAPVDVCAPPAGVTLAYADSS